MASTSSKERQAKFRKEMLGAVRADGLTEKKQITLYVDRGLTLPEIKTRLAGDPPAASAQPKAALDDLAAREQALAEREQHVARLETFKKLNISEYGLHEKERRLIEQRRSLEQRRAEIEREEKALAKRADTEKMSFGDRRKRLIEAHTTTIDFKTRERKIIDTAWSSADMKKSMEGLSRKTRIAANTIESVMAQFGRHELLSEREKAALDLAKGVLGQLAEAAGEAKEIVANHAKRIADEEASRNRTSQIWAKKAFDLTTAPMLVAVAEWFRDTYDLRSIRQDVINEGALYHIDRLRSSPMNRIANKIADAIKAGAAPDTATAQVRAEFDAAMPAAVEKHAELIRDLNTKLVQSQLEKANAKEQKRIK